VDQFCDASKHLTDESDSNLKTSRYPQIELQAINFRTDQQFACKRSCEAFVFAWKQSFLTPSNSHDKRAHRNAGEFAFSKVLMMITDGEFILPRDKCTPYQ
jgi:hypothetical protein